MSASVFSESIGTFDLVECQTCGNRIDLTKTGRMRKHPISFTTIPCPESGHLPKAKPTTSAVSHNTNQGDR